MSSVFKKIVDDVLGFDLPRKPSKGALVAPEQPVVVPDKDSGDDFLPPGKPEEPSMEQDSTGYGRPNRNPNKGFGSLFGNASVADAVNPASVVNRISRGRRNPMRGYGRSDTRRIARNRLGMARRGKGRGFVNDLLGG